MDIYTMNWQPEPPEAVIFHGYDLSIETSKSHDALFMEQGFSLKLHNMYTNIRRGRDFGMRDER
jgi:hypothetical protein